MAIVRGNEKRKMRGWLNDGQARGWDLGESWPKGGEIRLNVPQGCG